MQAVLRDLRYATRTLGKSRGVVVVAVLALTLGLGLTTTIFSIVYAALIKGLDYDGADRIAVIQRTNPARDIRQMPMPIHDFVEYRTLQRSFESLAAYHYGTVNVSGTERAERYVGAWVTANTFAVYGAKPALGRGFREGEDQPGGEQVAVIGYRMWQDRFHGDSSVIGTVLRANGLPFTIVGVMPSRFELPENATLWLPLQLDPLRVKRGEGEQLSVMGRLKPGVSRAAAATEVKAIASRIESENKETNDGVSAQIVTFMQGELGPQAQLLYTMLGAVFLVLLMACANVANLLLDRAARRSKEVAIRVGLGASRFDVVRQFLIEALVLALIASLLGMVLAYYGIDLFNRAIVDHDPPSWFSFRLRPAVVFFALGLGVVAALISGVLPAIQASRSDISELLKDESRGSSSLKMGRVSRVLVVFEIALSCGLLVAAGLMIKSVANMRDMDPGFATANLFTARIGFPAAYTDTVMQRRFFEQLEPKLAAIPGARAVSLSSVLPGAPVANGDFAVAGSRYATDRDYPRASTLMVTPDFFKAFDLRVLHGRGIEASDRADAVPVAVVSQRFATKFFKGSDVVGQRIRMGGRTSEAPWRTIVGVVPDSYSGDPAKPLGERVYLPLAQNRTNFVSIAVRSDGNPMALTPAVREAVASINPDVPIYAVLSMEASLASRLWFIQVFGTMFMIFGFIALFLAAIGLYAMMAFSVSGRTREIGVRVALGARESDVLRLVLGQGMRQLAVGLAVGLALSLAISQLMSVVLFDVQPRDPVIFGSVVAVLAIAGLMACFVPARRAARLDPLIALRDE